MEVHLPETNFDFLTFQQVELTLEESSQGKVSGKLISHPSLSSPSLWRRELATHLQY
jgi:hypothetical protein